MILSLILMLFPVTGQAAVYLPMDGSAEEVMEILGSLDETASRGENEMTALGIIFQDFDDNQYFSNAAALRIAYRTVGKEENCLNDSVNPEMRKKAGLGEYDETAWADGFYMHALNDGLITSIEFTQSYEKKNPLHKDKPVTAKRFAGWMKILHGADETEMPNYKATYMTKSDIALVLSFFEPYILPKMGMVVHEGKVVKVTEKYTEDKINRIVAVSTEKNYIEIRIDLDKNVPVFRQLENELVVIGKGRADTSGALRAGDKLKLYMKDKALYFASVTEYEKKEEYTDGLSVYSGNLYFYDSPGGYIVLDNVKSYADNTVSDFMQMQMHKGTDVMFEHKQIKTEELNTIFDKHCFVYMKSTWAGGLERVCHLVIE